MEFDDPNPTQPPGFENITLLIDWTAWAVLIVCFIMFIVNGARIAMAYRNNETEGMKGAVLALVGALIVGGAAAIFQALS